MNKWRTYCPSFGPYKLWVRLDHSWRNKLQSYMYVGSIPKLGRWLDGRDQFPCAMVGSLQKRSKALEELALVYWLNGMIVYSMELTYGALPCAKRIAANTQINLTATDGGMREKDREMVCHMPASPSHIPLITLPKYLRILHTREMASGTHILTGQLQS